MFLVFVCRKLILGNPQIRKKQLKAIKNMLGLTVSIYSWKLMVTQSILCFQAFHIVKLNILTTSVKPGLHFFC
mgnify:CR=1 FL=1